MRSFAFLALVAISAWVGQGWLGGLDGGAPASLSKMQTLPGGGGGAKNIVQLVNRTDGRLRVSGQVQLARVPGPSAQPTNVARALASCNGCQTYAVALQIALESWDANYIAPQNAAVAVNYQCNGCVTMARAIQYAFQVDDPAQPPPRVQELINAMNREIDAIQREATTIAEADARVDAVIADFRDLAANLREERQEATDVTTPGAEPPPAESA